MIKFPENFLWGAATSAYQVEGNNVNSDWWPWEKAVGHQQSGQACRHYERYAEDFDLAKSLNHNAHRLSLEWARIEPEAGEFSQEALDHYLNVILALRSRNIEPMVTLHHFTNPIWLSKEGGWENRRVVDRFVRYSDVVIRALGKHVRYWITINEPTIYISHSYIMGWWPPQEKSVWKAKVVRDHMVAAHVKAYRLIHNIYQELNLPKPSVSIAQHIPALVACSPSLRNRFAAYCRDKWLNFEFLDNIMRQQAMDFVGLNYYSRQLVDVGRWSPGSLLSEVCRDNHDPVEKNFLGWDVYPKGIYEVLLKLKKYDLPVIVTENGICTSDDQQRWRFIVSHLKNIHAAIEQGVNVTGYLHWSLLDNFEWDKGFKPRFGLVGIDYHTFQRTVRDSARALAQVCRTGVLE